MSELIKRLNNSASGVGEYGVDTQGGFYKNEKLTREDANKIIKCLKNDVPHPCKFCENHYKGDTLYESSDWGGGIGFDYIRDIKFCPLCGKELPDD